MPLNSISQYRDQLLSILKLQRNFVSAKGDWLYDEDGNRIYDALSQYGTQIFGHNNEELTNKAAHYLKGHNTNFIQPLYSKATLRLASKLSKVISLDLPHLCMTNSGTESVEAAIKLARLKTGKTKVISLENSFHGKTYSALSASGSKRYKIDGIFDPDNYISIAQGDLTTLNRALQTGEIAAFIFEPVLGEGGMIEADPKFIHQTIDLCKQHNVVVIADEIQCGLGRCGSLVYSQRLSYDIDILLLGKGLSGGLVPIGVMLYSKKVYIKTFEKKHSSTFAGGGFASSVALNVLDMLCRDKVLISSVRHLSECVDDHSQRLKHCYGDKVEVSGVGLMRAISFANPHCASNYFTLFIHNSGMLSYIICSYLLDKFSILTMPLMSQPCAIRFEPALTTSAIQIDRFFEAIGEVADLINKGRYDILMAHLADIDRAKWQGEVQSISIENSDSPQIEPILHGSSDYGDFDFAFFIHVTSEADLVKIFPRSMHQEYTPEQQLRMSKLLIKAGSIDPSPDVVLAFRVNNGVSKRKGLLIFSPLTPKHMMKLSPREKTLLIDEYFSCAINLGAKVIGLGAYTSVITRAGLDIANRYPDICITTGNSLTAISTYEQFKSVYRHDPKVMTSVIGGRGSVGRVVTLSVLNDVPRLILVGKSNTSVDSYKEFLSELIFQANDYQGPYRQDSLTAQIKALVARLTNGSEYSSDEAISILCSNDIASAKPITLSSDVVSCLTISNYVVSCTSEGKPFLDDNNLKEGAVALDAGRPFDFLISKNTKAKVYEAGLVKQPHPLSYGDCNMVVAQPGVNLACFSETIILSLEGAKRNYSIGKTIDRKDVSEIKVMAEKNQYVPCVVEQNL